MKHLLSFADRMYCINLDERPDRWQLVSKEFARVGIAASVTRVAAVSAPDPRLGCLQSHQLCIQEAIENKYENIVIFEDDVCFVDCATDFFADVAAFLQQDTRWDLFYLGGNVMYPARFVHRHVFRSRFFSTHAYVINKRAFHACMRAEVPIDRWYAWNTVSYGLYPMYATQETTYSDIRGQVIGNLEEAFGRKYDLLVKPNIVMRWVNYVRTHYLTK